MKLLLVYPQYPDIFWEPQAYLKNHFQEIRIPSVRPVNCGSHAPRIVGEKANRLERIFSP